MTILHYKTSYTPKGIEIVDLGQTQQSPTFDYDSELLQHVLCGLRHDTEMGDVHYRYKKQIPTVVLYDTTGLQIYDEITNVPEYYLYGAELELLKAHGDEIADTMFHKRHNDTSQQTPAFAPQPKVSPGKWGDAASGSENYGVNGHLGRQVLPTSPEKVEETFVVELGAGSLKKTSVLLRSLAKTSASQQLDMTYYAVDLEHDELVTTLDALAKQESTSVSAERQGQDHKVVVKGVRASYDSFKPYLSPSYGLFPQGAKKALLWLGSSLGNFTRPEASDFLKQFVEEGLNPGDAFLIGIDSTCDAQKVELAYGDPGLVTERFILNGLNHVASLFAAAGIESNFEARKFEYVHRYNSLEGCHEAYVRAKADVYIQDTPFSSIKIQKGELLLIERSYKYSQTAIDQLFEEGGLRVLNVWKHPDHDYGLYLVEKPAFFFPSTRLALSQGGVPFGLPSLDEWKELWKAFDCVTLEMIPPHLLHVKPIDLRHICLFYIGHIPTFLQIHLSRALGEDYTPPASYTQIFERGIDPNLDDPTQCHDHSIVPEAPEDWPSLKEILDYRDRVRQRLCMVYNSGRLESISKKNRRLARAIWMVYEHEAMHLETLLYMLLQKSEEVLSPLGFAIPQWHLLAREWNAQVEREAESRQKRVSFSETTITLGHEDDDTIDLETPLADDHVFGWDNEHGVRSVTVPAFKMTPVPISNLDYSAFLKQKQYDPALVPSSWWKKASGEHEYGVRVLFAPGYVDFKIAQHWPVQASGRQLAAFASWKGGRLPTEPEFQVYRALYASDEPGSNVGFKHWHPVPAKLPAVGSDGTTRIGGSNGGVWEWTSTNFDAHRGFSSSVLYPGYSSDFFDDTHSVILGGSWATLPRLAGRETLRNWFQTPYPYVFAGARVVYDV